MNVPIEIIVVVIGVFFSILGFGFLVIWQNTKAINSINITLSEINTKDKFEEKECAAQHSYISKKFSEHGSKIEAHSMLLTEHEAKLKQLLK
jgi:hypothetical protein